MNTTRRTFVRGAASLAAAIALPALAQPRGPSRLVVGFPAGGAADALARALLEPMKAALGVPMIVENRPGAGGRIAAEQVRNSPADGSLLLVSPASIITLAPHLYKSVRYEVARDFLPLSPIARLDLGVYVGPGAPEQVRTLPDLVKWLQGEPAKRSCGIPASARRRTWPRCCSAARRSWTGRPCPTRATHRPSSRCCRAKCRWASRRWRAAWNTCGPASCGCWR